QGAQSMAAAAIYLPDPPTLAQLRADPLRGIAGFGAVALVAGGFVAALVAAGRALARRDLRTAALGVWALTVAAFGAYWAPDDFQFWMFLLPPLYLIAARAWPAAGFGALVLPIVVWNLTAGALPRHDPATNTGLIVTQCLSERLGPNDLLITPGWDWAGDYVPYFTAIPVVSLQDVYVLAARNDPSAFFREVDRRIAETRAAGGRVYLVRLDTMTADEAAFFRRVTGLSAADFPWRRVDAFRCEAPAPRARLLPLTGSSSGDAGARGELVREVLP
ncbi:MAG: hypothetical protein NZ518_03310, partial [Dehalococcoidia bacterium]|nr:hypothetical protein [Dehalococcoidia bacterium]